MNKQNQGTKKVIANNIIKQSEAVQIIFTSPK